MFSSTLHKIAVICGGGGCLGVVVLFLFFSVFHFKIILYAPNVCFADGRCDIVLLCCNE